MFIDRQPPPPRFLFVFQRRGSVACEGSGRVLRAAEKQKEISWAVWSINRPSRRDFKAWTPIRKHRICNSSVSVLQDVSAKDVGNDKCALPLWSDLTGSFSRTFPPDTPLQLSRG